mmetsp:Transcript_30135/g.42031  ORF Transcript_30135/g.42031 Transcript_30135/m.42031 type:complete len:112 (-) Transcript_30135:830-1165(-)
MAMFSPMMPGTKTKLGISAVEMIARVCVGVGFVRLKTWAVDGREVQTKHQFDAPTNAKSSEWQLCYQTSTPNEGGCTEFPMSCTCAVPGVTRLPDCTAEVCRQLGRVPLVL